jgi:hypothetical protein
MRPSFQLQPQLQERKNALKKKKNWFKKDET